MGPSTSSARTAVTKESNIEEWLGGLKSRQRDQQNFELWDQSVYQGMLVRSVFFCFSSVLCVLLNCMLMYFLLTQKNFRKLMFYPLFLQALIDVFGAGLANIVYEVLSTMQIKAEIASRLSDDNDYEDDYYDPEILLVGGLVRAALINGPLGCVLTSLRSFLNEYSTGVCVMLGAFVRFISVCYPTSVFIKKKAMRVIIVGLHVYLVAALLLNFAYFRYRGLYRIDHLWVECAEFIVRNSEKLVIDFVVCLALPASISAFCYFRLAIKLFQRGRHVSRNRNLTIAFLVSWILWIVCWCPNYLGMTFYDEESYGEAKRESLTKKSNLSSVLLKHLMTTRIPFQMLYSHINPLIFLVVMKPFRQWILQVYHGLFFRENGDTGAAQRSMKNVVSKITLQAFPANRVEKKKENGNVLMKPTLLCLAVVAIALSLTGVVLFSTNHSCTFAKTGIEDLTVELQFGRKQHLASKLLFQDISKSDDAFFNCHVNHASMSFEFGRCFFVLAHSGSGKNLTEQISACAARKAVLSYPRTQEEMWFIWNFYMGYRNWNSEKKFSISDSWYLHVGYVKVRNTGEKHLFTSVDGKRNISTAREEWFQGRYNTTYTSWMRNKPVKGPAVCVTSDNLRPYDCLPRSKLKYSVCSIDLTGQYRI